MRRQRLQGEGMIPEAAAAPPLMRSKMACALPLLCLHGKVTPPPCRGSRFTGDVCLGASSVQACQPTTKQGEIASENLHVAQ